MISIARTCISSSEVNVIIFIQMYKQNEKYSSTFYNDTRKKNTKTPPKNEAGMRRTQQKSIDPKKKLVENQNFHDVALH